MPTAKIQRATAKGKTWKATFTVNGKQRTIQGGQKGVKVGPSNRSAATVKAFKARHGTATAKQHINNALWGNKKIGDTITVPASKFKK
jgi:hypothetical protein